jgi:hypothetical protein
MYLGKPGIVLIHRVAMPALGLAALVSPRRAKLQASSSVSSWTGLAAPVAVPKAIAAGNFRRNQEGRKRFYFYDAAYFKERAEEGALSRLWAGIHFRSDLDAGLKLGRSVGQLTVEKAAHDETKVAEGRAP